MAPIVSRGAERRRLFVRFRDEHAGPPNGTEAALRCTAHDRFILWVSPPLPPAGTRVECPPECGPGTPRHSANLSVV